MLRRHTALIISSALASVVALATATGCSSAATEEEDANEGALSNKNMTGADFGLQPGELMLTIDDGPGPRTPELVDFLVREQVPAVFFEVGKNAAANLNATKYVASHSAQVPGGLIIANHSMNHAATPLPGMGRQGAQDEILNADKILKDYIKQAQAHMGEPTFYFRPPYGAFTALGAANIATINANGAAKYVGPVFWNIGGELKGGFSADWACWGSAHVPTGECMNGYIREVESKGVNGGKGKGVILVHDVHSKTIDMLTGAGTANGRSLIKELKAKGYKFVGIREHDTTVRHQTDQQQQQSTAAEIVASTKILDDGQTQLTIEATGAKSLSVFFDDHQDQAKSYTDLHQVVKEALGPGLHVATVVALDANGQIMKVQKATFVVPAPLDHDSDDAHGGAACVNFNLLSKGQKFYLYHGKVDCSAPNAKKPIGIDECYGFLADITASKDPALVGANEWAVDFDVRYAADPNDKSKMHFVVDAQTGEIVTGVRDEWTIGSTSRADVPITGTSVDCAKGVWHGLMNYSNGKTEEVLFRTTKDGSGTKDPQP